MMPEEPPPSNKLPYERLWARNSRLKAILAMTHPTAVIIFAFITWILSIVTLSGIPSLPISIPLVLSMAFIQASNGMFNDVFDWRLDKVYKPWRAIPAGMISPGAAAVLATALLCLGLLFAAWLSFVAMILLVLGAVVGILYSAWLKRTAFSWLAYAINYPSFPVWVMVALGRFVPNILVIYLLAFPFVIAVHLTNQLRDFDEDLLLGMRGLVQRLGKERSTRLCFVLLVISPLPYLIMGGLSGEFIVFVFLLAVSYLHWFLTIPLLKKPIGSLSPATFRVLFRHLQISGPLMLLAWYWVFIQGLL